MPSLVHTLQKNTAFPLQPGLQCHNNAVSTKCSQPYILYEYIYHRKSNFVLNCHVFVSDIHRPIFNKT